MAWLTHRNVGSVGYLPALEKSRPYPIVLFLPNVSGGWRVEPWHTRASQVAACRGLHSEYLTSRRDPGGFLVRRRAEDRRAWPSQRSSDPRSTPRALPEVWKRGRAPAGEGGVAAPLPGAGRRGRARGPVHFDRGVGEDAPELRRLRLARVGSPGRGRRAQHQRRAVVEAAPVPVHRALRAVRPLRAVAVDDHVAGGGAERRVLRRPDRLPVRCGRGPRRGARGRGRPPCSRVRRSSASRPTGTTRSASSRTR